MSKIQKVRVGDIDMAHRWEGLSADETDQPVVMMAHAMGTSQQIWDAQIPALADGYRLLRYDWRGHGDTDAPEGPYTLDQFVGDAVGLIDALGLDRVHWVGISTGGMIGQGVAIEHGDRLASLSLCNTTSQSNEWYRNWVAERQAVVKAQGMDPVWEMTKRLWFTDAFVEAETAAYHAVREVFVRTQIPGYIGGTSAVADLAYRDRLGEITTPTRIIAAGDDPATPLERAHEIQAGIAGSELTIIDGMRHFSNVEVPDQFNPILRAGLDAMVEV